MLEANINFDIAISEDHSICTVTFDSPFRIKTWEAEPSEFHQGELKFFEASRLESQINQIQNLKTQIDLLKADVYSLVLLRGAVDVSGVTGTPKSMKDTEIGSSWYSAANAVTTFFDVFGINLVSYECENSGKLYVHLAPQEGETLFAQRSRGRLRGHTDAAMFPLNLEERKHPKLPPGPDTVVLVGLRNNQKIPTRIAPLSSVFRKISEDDINLLSLPFFNIKPQISFDLDDEFLVEEQSVLDRTSEAGWRVRFSNAAMSAMDLPNIKKLSRAFDNFSEAVLDSFQDVVINEGDIVLINNRTAIHGRGYCPMTEDEADKRWLLRTYGQHTVDQAYCVSEQAKHILCMI